MITLKGKNIDIQLNSDGSYFFNNQNYFAKDRDKLLHKKLYLFLKNQDFKKEFNFDELPLYYASSIYKELFSIKDDLTLNVEEKEKIEDDLTKFGFDVKDQITKLQEEKYLNLLFKAGFSKLKFDNNKMDKVNDVLYSAKENEKNNQFVQTFLTNFKQSKSNNFALFCETVQELTHCDEKEVFRMYNDKIDEHFVLDSDEYKFIHKVKQQFIEKQEQIIANAIKYGFEVPTELPRFIAPSNKFKDVILNPEKAKMIARFDFGYFDKKNKYESPHFDENEVKEDQKAEISERMKKALHKINIDIGNNTDFVSVQLFKNNGFDYNKFKNWAMCTTHNGVENVDDAFQTINNGLLHCNRLVEAGILKCTGDGTYKFTSDRCRDILFDNPYDDYVELSNKVIDTYNISYNLIQKAKEDKIALIETQKKDFFTYLDAQYESYYKPQEKSLDEFIEDIYHVKNTLGDKNIDVKYNGEEFNYCKNLYPELFQSVDNFSDIIDKYKEEKTYHYVRDENYDFSNDNKIVNDKFKNLKKKDEQTKNENDPIKKQFKDISSLKFGGVILNKLAKYKEYGIKNGKDEKVLDNYVKKAIERAEALVDAKILIKDEKGDYTFTDDYAKKVLFENLGADIHTLRDANKGFKTKIKLSDNENLNNKENGLEITNLIRRFENFNFNYRYSKNKKFKNSAKNIEDLLKKDLLVAYSSGDKEIINYFENHKFNEKDNRFRKKIVKEIKNTDLNKEVKNIVANYKNPLELK